MVICNKWEKMKNEHLGKKNEREERKKEENCIKTGEKALKLHLLRLLTQQIFASRQPPPI